VLNAEVKNINTVRGRDIHLSEFRDRSFDNSGYDKPRHYSKNNYPLKKNEINVDEFARNRSSSIFSRKAT